MPARPGRILRGQRDGEGDLNPGTAQQEQDHHRNRQQRGGWRERHVEHARA